LLGSESILFHILSRADSPVDGGDIEEFSGFIISSRHWTRY